MKTMKNIKYLSLIAGSLLLAACSDFDEVNTDPKAANVDQVQVEYVINQSITQAQQDPDVAERSFILYWKTAARQHRQTGFSNGADNDGWTTNYYNQIAGWLTAANLAIQVAEEQIASGTAKEYTPNLMQVARIWRAYLMSEFTDNFGPMPLDGFQGTNPTFSDVESVYNFILSELKDASAKLDLNVKNTTESFTKLDRVYGFDFAKWQKYANSMRLRLAMRLSEVDPSKAQSEFEDAVKGALIQNATEAFTVAERPGWDALTGVMTREWNAQLMAASQNNIFIGLGGIKTADRMPSYAPYVKPADWMGIKYDQHFSSMTNDPSAGFWYDGIQPVMDPRAYSLYIAPGDFDNPNFNAYPSWDQTARTVQRDLVDANGATVVTIDASFTWNGAPLGDWGEKGSKNFVYSYNGTNPRLSNQFRASASSRIFFAEWETYFLIAEAAVRGWSVPMDGKTAYENGIRANFAYWNLSQFVDAYIASTDFNRVGTSVSWTHTTEPSGTKAMRYKDGYTGAEGVYQMPYPTNTIYKNGTVKNDQLTKIITQKFIAQAPWLPMEVWSDQRRLGLPFLENPCVEKPLLDMPALTQSNYMTNSVAFYPQRLKYPASLENSNPEGYRQAVSHLGSGGDFVLTPLWWAKH